jgi:cell division protein FtsB
MERTKKEKNVKKLLNRAFSYIVLIFSIFALCFSIKEISNYIVAKRENKVLQSTLQELKECNEKLEITSSKLKDREYFSVYVKDKYQYSSNDDSIIPIK